MKKNLFKSSIIISGVLAFAACQKQSISPDTSESAQLASKGKPPQEMIRVKTMTIDQEVRTYNYDANGRSLGYTSNQSGLTYEYPDAAHVVETPASSIVANYELNSKGLAIKKISGANIFQDFFTYNGKKQVVEDFGQDNGGNVTVNTYNYVNGNVDNRQLTYNGALSASITFTYYTDKPNVLDNDVFGESFRGLGSKNLIKSSTTQNAGISGTSVIDYSYVFDVQGRVIKVSRVGNGIAMPDIIYTY